MSSRVKTPIMGNQPNVKTPIMGKPQIMQETQELSQRIYTAWSEVLPDVPVLAPTEDSTFPGLADLRESVAVCRSGTLWVSGHFHEKQGFVPAAGPFDSADEAIAALIGIVANRRAAIALGRLPLFLG